MVLADEVAEVDWVVVLPVLVSVELVVEEPVETDELVVVVDGPLDEYCSVTLVTFTSRYFMVLFAAGGSDR